jgi:hypothetical protein
MSDAALPALLARIAGSRRITAEDALDIRRTIFGEMDITPIEAEALIALDEAAQERSPEWSMLFVEALTDFLVRQRQPAGYVDEAGADWLLSVISRDGQIRTDSELDLLVHILEAAERAPRRLTDFALAQVKQAVLHGQGPLARSGRLQQGCMGEAEVELLRRILYACAGEGNVAVTRSEAEVLFDINDAVRDQPNHESWNDLFARAIGAAIMTVSTYEAPSSDVAARREAWLSEPESLGSFVGRMFNGRQGAAFDGVFGEDSNTRAWRERNEAADEALAAAEVVGADESYWLRDRIGRDGEFDSAERALIAFLREEAPQIDDALDPLLTAQAAEPMEGPPPAFGKRRSLA